MKPERLLFVSLAIATVWCGCRNDASGTSGAASQRPQSKTRIEKVTMGGVAWEVELPLDMKAPQYKVNNPEYLGDDEMRLALDATFPVFATPEDYIKANVATKVLEKKQSGDAYFIVAEAQAHNAGQFLMTALIPGKPIGWRCSGLATREADIRAMCSSVRFKKE